MSVRREIELGVGGASSGIKITVLRAGVEIFGWYDHIVGIEGRLISWDELDRAREFVKGKVPTSEWEPAHD